MSGSTLDENLIHRNENGLLRASEEIHSTLVIESQDRERLKKSSSQRHKTKKAEKRDSKKHRKHLAEKVVKKELRKESKTKVKSSKKGDKTRTCSLRWDEQKHASSTEKIESKVMEKRQISQLNTPLGGFPNRVLVPDKDYFEFHQHLKVYLFREEGINFGELSSKESRNAFLRFCERYNAGTLDKIYYEALPPSEIMQQTNTATYKWKFNTNEAEVTTLQMIEDGVRKQTEYNK
jgi:hypothetical protein